MTDSDRFTRLQESDRVNVTRDPHGFRDDAYKDYLVTVSRGGKTYQVASVAAYASGHFYAVAHHDMTRLAVTRRAWSHVMDVAGIGTDREERWQATRSGVRSLATGEEQ